MQSWTWRAILFGALAIVIIITATRPDPETDVITHATPAELAQALRNPRELVRRSATARLIAMGPAAVGELQRAAKSAQDDHLATIFLVLEDMYVSGNELVADEVELAVEELAKDERREVRQASDELFQSNLMRRHLRACAKFESLGGRLVASPFAIQPGESQYSNDLAVIPAEWHGGETGLKLLTRIRGLSSIHLATSAAIDESQLEMLAHYFVIRREDEPCLGVELREREAGLLIRRLVPRSPADRAGLDSMDILLELNGVPVHSYPEFLQVMRQHHPGETVEMKIVREDQPQVIPVVLGTDFGTGRCRCHDDDPSSSYEGAGSSPPLGRDGRYLPMTDRVGPALQGGPGTGQLPAGPVARPLHRPR